MEGISGDGLKVSMGWYVRAEQKIEHLLAPINVGAVTNSCPLCSHHRVTWIKTKREGVWRADAPARSNWTSLVRAAKLINAATPGLGTSACNLPMKHHHAFVTPVQPHQGEWCRKSKYIRIRSSLVMTPSIIANYNAYLEGQQSPNHWHSSTSTAGEGKSRGTHRTINLYMYYICTLL